MTRVKALLAAWSLLVVGLFVAVTPTASADTCWIGPCYWFRSSLTNVLTIPARAGDTSKSYGVRPGHKSHYEQGGIQFYVPAGCKAKTSLTGKYWAKWGWHNFPHHYGTVTLKPVPGLGRDDC